MPSDISIQILVIFFIGNLFRSAFGTGGNLFIASILGLSYDLKLIVPYLTIMLLLNRLIMLKKSVAYVNLSLLNNLIIGAVLGSFIGSFYLYKFSDSATFKLIWGLFLVCNSILIGSEKNSAFSKFNLKFFTKAGMPGFIFGIMRSAFGVGGGPFLALYYGSMFKDKESIRANLIVSGIFFSICQFCIYLYLGMITSQILMYVAISIPLLIISTFLGDMLFFKINNKIYHKMMMATILFAGIITILEVIL
jgi:uncharacterized protein